MMTTLTSPLVEVLANVELETYEQFFDDVETEGLSLIWSERDVIKFDNNKVFLVHLPVSVSHPPLLTTGESKAMDQPYALTVLHLNVYPKNTFLLIVGRNTVWCLSYPIHSPISVCVSKSSRLRSPQVEKMDKRMWVALKHSYFREAGPGST